MDGLLVFNPNVNYTFDLELILKKFNYPNICNFKECYRTNELNQNYCNRHKNGKQPLICKIKNCKIKASITYELCWKHNTKNTNEYCIIFNCSNKPYKLNHCKDHFPLLKINCCKHIYCAVIPRNNAKYCNAHRKCDYLNCNKMTRKKGKYCSIHSICITKNCNKKLYSKQYCKECYYT